MSLKAVRRLSGISVECEGETVKSVFKAIAGIDEIFGQSTCGMCGCQDVRFSVRTVDENDYHEMVCQNPDCGAKLAFGQNKKGGGLFPKRSNGLKGADRKYLDHGGWSREFRNRYGSNEESE